MPDEALKWALTPTKSHHATWIWGNYQLVPLWPRKCRGFPMPGQCFCYMRDLETLVFKFSPHSCLSTLPSFWIQLLPLMLVPGASEVELGQINKFSLNSKQTKTFKQARSWSSTCCTILKVVWQKFLDGLTKQRLLHTNSFHHFATVWLQKFVNWCSIMKPNPVK